MDLTQSLAKSVDALSAQLPGILQKLTDAGAADEATALAGLHTEIQAGIAALVDGELKIVATIETGLRNVLDGAGVKLGSPDGSPYGFTLKLAPPKPGEPA